MSSKQLKVADILQLQQVMPEGRKAIKSRLKGLSLARDAREINQAVEIIREELEAKKPEPLKKLEEKFREKFSKAEEKQKAEGKPVDYLQLELEVRSEFKDYNRMQQLREELEKETKKYMKLPFPIDLHTKVEESDLPKELSPAAADMAVIFMEYHND